MTAPKPNIVLIPSNWTKSNVRLNVTLPTGITASAVQRQIMFTKGNLFGTTQKETNVWHNWAANAYATENQTVYARYVFKVDTTVNGVDYQTGNISEVTSHSVSNIDKILPIITIVPKEDDIKIIDDKTSADETEVTASDEISGIKEFTYKQDGIGPIDASSKESVVLPERGVYDFTATDNAGNQTSKQITLVDGPKIITTPQVENGGTYDFDMEINSLDETNTLKVNGGSVEIPYTLKVIEGEKVTYDIELFDIYGKKDVLNFILFKEKAAETNYRMTKKYFTREEIQSILEENSYNAEVTYRDREKRDNPKSFIVYHKLPSNSLFADNILHIKTTLVQVSFFHKRKLDNIDELMMDNFNVEPVALDSKDMNSDYYADHYRFEIMTGGGW